MFKVLNEKVIFINEERLFTQACIENFIDLLTLISVCHIVDGALQSLRRMRCSYQGKKLFPTKYHFNKIDGTVKIIREVKQIFMMLQKMPRGIHSTPIKQPQHTNCGKQCNHRESELTRVEKNHGLQLLTDYTDHYAKNKSVKKTPKRFSDPYLKSFIQLKR